MTQARASSPARLKAVLSPRGFSDLAYAALVEAFRPYAQSCLDAQLVRAEYEDGASGFLLVLAGAHPQLVDMAPDLAEEALDSVGRRDQPLQLTFVPEDDPALKRLRAIGWPIVSTDQG